MSNQAVYEQTSIAVFWLVSYVQHWEQMKAYQQRGWCTIDKLKQFRLLWVEWINYKVNEVSSLSKFFFQLTSPQLHYIRIRGESSGGRPRTVFGFYFAAFFGSQLPGGPNLRNKIKNSSWSSCLMPDAGIWAKFDHQPLMVRRRWMYMRTFV